MQPFTIGIGVENSNCAVSACDAPCQEVGNGECRAVMVVDIAGVTSLSLWCN